MATNEKNKRRGGFYWHPETNEPFVSVTTVIDQALKKDQLENWKMQQVYRSVLRDPQISEREALQAPWKAADSAKSTGSTVHSLIESYRVSQALAEPSVPEFKLFADAFYQWIKDYKVRVVENEKTVFSHRFGYAGTLDMLCTFGDDPGLVLVDFKTSKGIYPQVFLQLSAYKQGLSEQGIEVNRMVAVVLKKDDQGNPTGKYVAEEGTDELGTFLSLKKIWEWQNRALLTDVKYKTYSYQ